MKEIWKNIIGHEYLYQISNYGRIYSLKRKMFLKPYNNGSGWMQVSLCGKKYLLSRLVALHFIPNPENKPEVNHLKEKTDNQAWNLEWSTRIENQHHAIKTGLKPHIGKLNETKVRELRIKHATGNFTYAQLSREYGVAQTTVREAINKTKWKHVI
jgi:hypothetical protein